MKVDVRCVATPRGGVKIETTAHVSNGSGQPMWVELIEIPAAQLSEFNADFNAARNAIIRLTHP